MLKTLLTLLCLFFINLSILQAQTSQISIGTTSITESFNDTKFDPNDGGTINVGYRNLNTGNSNDLLLVKLSSTNQLVWQKSFSNAGDDILYRVIVCANGDYVTAGQIFQGGLRKAFVCRVSSINGNVIWSKISSNSTPGELFWDVIETTNNNIALAGLENFTAGQTNSFLVLLNSGGNNIWSMKSSTGQADEFRSLAQLPNGNLIVSGFYNPTGSNYHLTISEINETTAAILNQNTYNISTSIFANPNFLESLWPIRIYIKNSTVIFELSAFQGFGSSSTLCAYTYDQTSKILTGNIYEHAGSGTLTGATIYPITELDFLFTASYSGPTEAFVSKVTNVSGSNTLVGRKINSSVNTVNAIDVLNLKVAIGGNIQNSDLNAYNFFSTIDIPVSSTPCSITNSNTLVLQSSVLNPTTQNVVILSATTTMLDVVLTNQSPSYTITNVCGFVLPVTLLNFEGIFNETDKSNNLKWSTSSELNSKEFVIEKSLDATGGNYYPIGSLNAGGYTNNIKNYYFKDKNPVNGTNLYRLMQIDIDNKFTYSKIISILSNTKERNIYSIESVPHNKVAYIKTTIKNDELINIEILDASGKIINRQKSNINILNPVKFSLSAIPSGVYFLRITSQSNKPYTGKILID